MPLIWSADRMDKLSMDELHALRLTLFDNADSLHKEAKLLFAQGFYPRAYLLAHFTCEELGKIPIVVGAIGCMLQNRPVNWKNVRKRFRDHKAKIDSDDFHHYVFGIDADLVRNSDLQWLGKARQEASGRIELKNASTYVDVEAGEVISPVQSISKEHAAKMIDRAFRSLRAHWQAEVLTNPMLQTANKAIQPTCEDVRG